MEHDISFPLQPRTNTEVKSHLQKPVCPFPFGSKIEKSRMNSSTKSFSSLKQDSLASGLKFVQNSSNSWASSDMDTEKYSKGIFQDL